MNRLYSLCIRFYYLVIIILSPFHKKANLWINGRRHWKTSLENLIKKDNKYIWFHCSSLGEYEDSSIVFSLIKNNFPTHQTILTVFSPTAYEALKKAHRFDILYYLPLDTPSNARNFISIVNPEMVIFSRSELWLNFLLRLKFENINTYLISLRLNSESWFLKKPFSVIYNQCFHSFRFIFCQNEETQSLLQKHFNYSETMMSGNTRVDSIRERSETFFSYLKVEQFITDRKVVIWGSSLPKDEKYFCQIYHQLIEMKIKWIVVPHEIEKSKLLKQFHREKIILYTELEKLNAEHDILLVNTIGQLKDLYKYVNFAIIGGGFDKIGIHNCIEPAIYGIPMAFGPNHRKYDEAMAFLKMGLAFTFSNTEECLELIKNNINRELPSSIQQQLNDYFFQNRDCSLKISRSIMAIHTTD